MNKFKFCVTILSFFIIWAGKAPELKIISQCKNNKVESYTATRDNDTIICTYFHSGPNAGEYYGAKMPYVNREKFSDFEKIDEKECVELFEKMKHLYEQEHK